MEDAEFDGQRLVGDRGGNGGVDAGGIALEKVKLVWGKGGNRAVCCTAKLEGALDAIVRELRWAENLGEFAGSMAAEGVHLEEAVLRGDEGLGGHEIVDRDGGDVGHAVGVALDGHRG